jgi:hypothetical protein
MRWVLLATSVSVLSDLFIITVEFTRDKSAEQLLRHLLLAGLYLADAPSGTPGITQPPQS